MLAVTTLLSILLIISNVIAAEFTTGLSQIEIHNTSNNTVHMIVLLSYPNPLVRASFAANYVDGHDITPAAFLAVEEINNCSDILKNYTLNLILSDGGCNVRERTVISYAKDLHRDYGRVPVIGLAGLIYMR